jgi:hypothetical protein
MHATHVGVTNQLRAAESRQRPGPRVTGRTRWPLLGPLAVADAAEVAWVAVQRWRGATSHFNFATTLGTALLLVGAAAIAVTVTVIVALAVLALTRLRAVDGGGHPRRARDSAGAAGGRRLDDRPRRGPASDGVSQGLTTVALAGFAALP